MSSLCAARRRPARRIMSPRSGAGVANALSTPRRVEATARAPSSEFESGYFPMTSFVSARMTLSKVSPDEAGTHWPAMKFVKFMEGQASDYGHQGSEQFCAEG